MRVLGLDIGSRTVDAVWLKDGVVVDRAVLDSGVEPQEVAAGLVDRASYDRVVATGYGRHAAVERFGAEVITEITAYALGAARLFPEVRSILDIGGQDTKVIRLGPAGRVLDFEMNDKCAAGTGRFLEVMARALGCEIDEIGAGGSARRGRGARQLDVHGVRRERGHRAAASRRAARQHRPRPA